MMRVILATGIFLLNLAAAKIHKPDKPPRCFDGVYMIFSRASGEPPGPGFMGELLAPKIKREIPHSGSVAVSYPAAVPVAQYNGSVSLGTQDMMRLVEEYVDRCPNHVVALFGYSQGAQVVGDTLCGSIETNEKKLSGLAPKYEKQILAAVQMGDPSFVPGLPWDFGNSTHHGEFPRPDAVKSCGAYSSRIQSFCDQHDFACASGNSTIVHLSYLLIYQPDVLNFMKSRWSYYQRTGLTSAPPKQGRAVATLRASDTIDWAMIAFALLSVVLS